MRTLTRPGVVAAVLLSAVLTAQERQPVRTVPAVDLSKYAGTWYEVAKFPNRFQRTCIGDVAADYAIRDDGRIDVTNRCRTEDSETDEARSPSGEDAAHQGLHVKLRAPQGRRTPVGRTNPYTFNASAITRSTSTGLTMC
jgi:lipocalin